MKSIFTVLSILLIISSIYINCIGQSDISENNTDKLINKLHSKMKEIKSVVFDMEQNIFIAGSTQTVAANISFKRPETIKIVYSKPHIQEIFFNDGSLYTYIPEIKQATKQQYSNINDILGYTPSLIFSEEPLKKETQDYIMSITKSAYGGYIALQLLTKNESKSQKFTIFINPDTFLPEKTVFTSPNIQSITVFTGYKINTLKNNDELTFNHGDDINTIVIE